MTPFLHRLLLAAVLGACLASAGCGYRPAGQGDGLQVLQGKTIAIPLFASKAYRPGLETLLTEGLVQEFALRSGGKVVTEEGDADLLLSGTVTAYTSNPVSYTAADQIKEYRAEMTVTVALRDRASRKVLWQASLTENQDYPVETDIALQLNREKAAIREVCRNLARRIYVKAGEDF